MVPICTRVRPRTTFVIHYYAWGCAVIVLDSSLLLYVADKEGKYLIEEKIPGGQLGAVTLNSKIQYRENHGELWSKNYFYCISVMVVVLLGTAVWGSCATEDEKGAVIVAYCLNMAKARTVSCNNKVLFVFKGTKVPWKSSRLNWDICTCG